MKKVLTEALRPAYNSGKETAGVMQNVDPNYLP